jgi:Domain of unknown function (DUF1772)
MFLALQVFSVVTVAVAMALTLAHALELPGKRRLTREQYLVVQPIYYPGFTFGGIAEPLGLLLLIALLVLTPAGGTPFWLTAGALAALATMHGVYWVLTHPVNNFWLKDHQLKGFSASFFFFDPLKRGNSAKPDWTVLRDRWEHSHVVRAGLGIASLLLLVTAVAL